MHGLLQCRSTAAQFKNFVLLLTLPIALDNLRLDNLVSFSFINNNQFRSAKNFYLFRFKQQRHYFTNIYFHSFKIEDSTQIRTKISAKITKDDSKIK